MTLLYNFLLPEITTSQNVWFSKKSNIKKEPLKALRKFKNEYFENVSKILDNRNVKNVERLLKRKLLGKKI